MLTAGAAPEGAELRLELRDGEELVGSLTVPVSQLQGHEKVSREMKIEASTVFVDQPCEVCFQVLDSAVVCAKRRVVYFVRHGESLWNAAQSKANVAEMARQTDHPLSKKGRDQAEALRGRLEAAARRGDPSAMELKNAGAVYTSPLCRAVQTAAIALGPATAEASASGEFVLMASAREKQNFGGLDTMSSRRGVEVIRGAFEELRDVLGSGDASPGGVLDSFARLRFDAAEAEERWWCETNAESSSQLQVRMKEFMSQLLYMPNATAAVVGHSHFFREIFRNCISQDFASKEPKLVNDLRHRKLQNCGVARVELEPGLGADGGPIVSVQLLLGTKLDAELGALGCCAAPGHTEECGPDGDTLVIKADPGDWSPPAAKMAT